MMMSSLDINCDYDDHDHDHDHDNYDHDDHNYDDNGDLAGVGAAAAALCHEYIFRFSSQWWSEYEDRDFYNDDDDDDGDILCVQERIYAVSRICTENQVFWR